MKLTDSNSGLDKFKRQNGLNISKAPSASSDYLKINQFKKDLKNRKKWLIGELTTTCGEKKAEDIFELFNNAIEKGNDITVSIIDKCEKEGSVLNEIIRRQEYKNVAFLKKTTK